MIVTITYLHSDGNDHSHVSTRLTGSVVARELRKIHRDLNL